MSSRRLQDMSSRHLQDMSSRSPQDMSSRRLQDMSSRPANVCWDIGGHINSVLYLEHLVEI